VPTPNGENAIAGNSNVHLEIQSRETEPHNAPFGKPNEDSHSLHRPIILPVSLSETASIPTDEAQNNVLEVHPHKRTKARVEEPEPLYESEPPGEYQEPTYRHHDHITPDVVISTSPPESHLPKSPPESAQHTINKAKESLEHLDQVHFELQKELEKVNDMRHRLHTRILASEIHEELESVLPDLRHSDHQKKNKKEHEEKILKIIEKIEKEEEEKALKDSEVEEEKEISKHRKEEHIIEERPAEEGREEDEEDEEEERRNDVYQENNHHHNRHFHKKNKTSEGEEEEGVEAEGEDTHHHPHHPHQAEVEDTPHHHLHHRHPHREKVHKKEETEEEGEVDEGAHHATHKKPETEEELDIVEEEEAEIHHPHHEKEEREGHHHKSHRKKKLHRQPEKDKEIEVEEEAQAERTEVEYKTNPHHAKRRNKKSETDEELAIVVDQEDGVAILHKPHREKEQINPEEIRSNKIKAYMKEPEAELLLQNEKTHKKSEIEKELEIEDDDEEGVNKAKHETILTGITEQLNIPNENEILNQNNKNFTKEELEVVQIQGDEAEPNKIEEEGIEKKK